MLVKLLNPLVSCNPTIPIRDAFVVDVIIDGTLIERTQVDNGSSVNVMSVEVVEEIRLKELATTPIVLKMADQSQIKSLGQLNDVQTIIERLQFVLDYVVFKVTKSISTYPILLGRP